MNIMQAAHELRRQQQGLSMGDALAWAWQCRRCYEEGIFADTPTNLRNRITLTRLRREREGSGSWIGRMRPLPGETQLAQERRWTAQLPVPSKPEGSPA